MSSPSLDRVPCFGCLEPRARISFDQRGRVMLKCGCGITVFTNNFYECLNGFAVLPIMIPKALEGMGGLKAVEEWREKWIASFRAEHQRAERSSSGVASGATPASSTGSNVGAGVGGKS